MFKTLILILQSSQELIKKKYILVNNKLITLLSIILPYFVGTVMSLSHVEFIVSYFIFIRNMEKSHKKENS